MTTLRSDSLTDLEGSSVLNVLIAYEDFATGHRAMRLCENLIAQLGKDFRFQTNSWKFELLRVPKLERMATQDAIEADVIIVSAHGSGELPAEVKSWMEGWMVPTQDNGEALVALLDHVEGSPEAHLQVRAYLQGLAQTARLDFFSHVYPNPGRGMEDSSSELAAPAETISWAIPDPGNGRRQCGMNE